MKRNWLMIIVVETIMLSFVIIATDIKQERHQTQELPPQSDFQPKDEYYLIEGNALKWIGGNYIKTQVLGIITSYTPSPEETDDTPTITASGQEVREGIVANNCLSFGTLVEWDGIVYEVQDRGNDRHPCEWFDLLKFSKEEALQWGIKTKQITIYE